MTGSLSKTLVGAIGEGAGDGCGIGVGANGVVDPGGATLTITESFARPADCP